VHHDIGEVYQNPPAVFLTFAVPWMSAGFGAPVNNLLRDGAVLHRCVALTDNKEIGRGGHARKVDRDDFFREFVLCRGKNQLDKFRTG
jgi:hypothetical protein